MHEAGSEYYKKEILGEQERTLRKRINLED
jgi:hypothetical protein